MMRDVFFFLADVYNNIDVNRKESDKLIRWFWMELGRESHTKGII